MKQKLLALAGGVILMAAVFLNPYSSDRSSANAWGFTKILHEWSEEQLYTSEEVTEDAVSGAEGTIVGEHQIRGSNWSIPNIIRFWIERWSS